MASTTSNPWPPLETSRLSMRVFDPSIESDYTNVLLLYNLPSLVALWGNRSITTPADIDALATKRVLFPSLCKKLSPGQSPPSHLWLLAHLKGSDEFVGFVGLFSQHEKPDWPPSLGYNFRPEYQGKGYATEAAVAALKWADEVLGLELVTAAASVNNFASCRVAEKAGGVDRGRKLDGGWERNDSMGIVVYEWTLGSTAPTE